MSQILPVVQHLNDHFTPSIARSNCDFVFLVMADPADGMPTVPPVGYRFRPTDEELVTNYLKPKLLGDDLEDLLIIAVVNVCKHEPWDLPGNYTALSLHLVFYCFNHNSGLTQ